MLPTSKPQEEQPSPTAALLMSKDIFGIPTSLSCGGSW